MSREVRERLILPFVIPIGAMVFIAALVFLFSRVLLAAPRQVAVAVALMLAINIVVVCALLAIPPRGLRVNSLLVIGVALAPLALGVVSTGVVEESVEKGHDATAPRPFRAAVSANNIAFNTNELSIPAGVRALLEFNNQEVVPHNVGIFKGSDATGEKIFTGDVITGPREIVYAILPLAPGAYFFRCDIHPTTMTGSIKVA